MGTSAIEFGGNFLHRIWGEHNPTQGTNLLSSKSEGSLHLAQGRQVKVPRCHPSLSLGISLLASNANNTFPPAPQSQL